MLKPKSLISPSVDSLYRNSGLNLSIIACNFKSDNLEFTSYVAYTRNANGIYPLRFNSLFTFFKSHFTYYIVWKSARLIFNPKIIQICFIFILCCQTGICQITFFVVPFLQSTVIEHFQIVLNNKWNNIVFQTLLEHNQSSHTTITVLERMNPLKLHMEVQNIRKGLFFFGVVFRQQGLHFIGNFFWKGCIPATGFIRKFLIITNSKPIFSRIAGAILQNQMKFFDEFLRQSCFCMINNHVNAPEVICRFDHIYALDDRLGHDAVRLIVRRLFGAAAVGLHDGRSEEHTSELQSH